MDVDERTAIAEALGAWEQARRERWELALERLREARAGLSHPDAKV